MTMSKLDNLADIVFVDADADEVESYVIGRYEAITGRTLAKGDPVRLFLLTIAALIVLLLNKINETGKQNLLRYATGDNLDHLGALADVFAEEYYVAAAVGNAYRQGYANRARATYNYLAEHDIDWGMLDV